MVTYPRHYIEPLAKAGANCFTFHYEAEYGNLKDVAFQLSRSAMLFGPTRWK
jgi:pentose-5-phosphate-3-epimerase